MLVEHQYHFLKPAHLEPSQSVRHPLWQRRRELDRVCLKHAQRDRADDEVRRVLGAIPAFYRHLLADLLHRNHDLLELNVEPVRKLGHEAFVAAHDELIVSLGQPARRSGHGVVQLQVVHRSRGAAHRLLDDEQGPHLLVVRQVGPALHESPEAVDGALARLERRDYFVHHPRQLLHFLLGPRVPRPAVVPARRDLHDGRGARLHFRVRDVRYAVVLAQAHERIVLRAVYPRCAGVDRDPAPPDLLRDRAAADVVPRLDDLHVGVPRVGQRSGGAQARHACADHDDAGGLRRVGVGRRLGRRARSRR